MEREVLWGHGEARTSSGRCVSCCLFQKGGLRPAWLIRLGLFLYDYIGGRKLLPATRTLDLAKDLAGGPLKKLFRKAFEYSDGWVDDARLVVLNARDAADRGADIRTGTKVVTARRENGHWNVETENVETGARETVRARMLVGQCGRSLVGHRFFSSAFGRNDVHNVRLVQGSHVVVKKKFRSARLLLPEPGRAYHVRHSLPPGRIIKRRSARPTGTIRGDPLEMFASATRKSIIFCASASEYFAEPVTRNDIVWTYSGARPLFDDGYQQGAGSVRRDYVLKVEGSDGQSTVAQHLRRQAHHLPASRRIGAGKDRGCGSA